MTQSAKIAIIGAGNIGSALAQVLANAGHHVTAWDHFDEVVSAINQKHHNPRFLPGVDLNPRIHATRAFSEISAETCCAFICIPAKHVVDTVRSLHEESGKPLPLVCMSKGVDPDSGRPAMLALAETQSDDPVFGLGGPCVAEEMISDQRGMLSLAGPAGLARDRIAALLGDSGQLLHIDEDLVGTAYGGVFKNVYAILFGYLSTSPAAGDNLLGAALSVCTAEALVLGRELGCETRSLIGPAGLGDLIATSLSGKSHNHRFGNELGSGASPDSASAHCGQRPEGAHSVHHLLRWADAFDVDVPLADLVGAMVSGEWIDYGRIEAALC